MMLLKNKIEKNKTIFSKLPAPGSPYCRTLYLYGKQEGVLFVFPMGSWGSSVVKCQSRDWKVMGSSPCKSGGRIFFSWVNFMCWLFYIGIHSNPVLTQ